jgi:hypothetical protein
MDFGLSPCALFESIVFLAKVLNLVPLFFSRPSH